MISSSHKFIYIHSPKTGGNSIQDALSKYADDKLVMLGDHQDGKERFALKNKKFKNLIKHSSLQDYWNAMGTDLNVYQIFTTIRNPFDRIVSFYFSPHRGSVVWDENEFKDFAKTVPSLENFLFLRESFFSKKKLATSRVDSFLKFENLDVDFSKMCEILGINNVQLPYRNQSKSRRNYIECYDDELIDWVYKNHQLEIKLGNYTFD